MSDKISKGMILAGVFSSETPDKSGEIISIDGMSIDNLNTGTAIVNSEHENGKFSSYLGRVISAKKILTKDDCSSDHERKCFENSGKNKMIYGKIELFNDEKDHVEAQHAAAVIRHFKKRDLDIAAKFSIEGASLEKDGNYIKRSVAKRVAITLAPCNSACESDVLSELSKSEKDLYSNMTDSYHEKKGVVSDILVLDQENIMKSLDNLQNVFSKLQKALAAGLAVGGPGTLTQGAALQGKPSKKNEESTEESTKESSNQMHDIDDKKVDAIDGKAKDMNVKAIKLKKAEVFIYKNLMALQKAH